MNFLQFAADNAHREFSPIADIHYALNRRWSLIDAGLTPFAALERTWWERSRRRSPITVCDGWTEPRHPRVVIKDGDPTRISHGMCNDCQARMYAEMGMHGGEQ